MAEQGQMRSQQTKAGTVSHVSNQMGGNGSATVTMTFSTGVPGRRGLAAAAAAGAAAERARRLTYDIAEKIAEAQEQSQSQDRCTC